MLSVIGKVVALLTATVKLSVCVIISVALMLR